MKNQVNYKHSPVVHNFSAARQVLPHIMTLKKISSVIDVGCGIGTWLAVAKELGAAEILGVDGVDLNQADLKIPIENFIKHDLTAPLALNRHFDLLLCLEVAEHLPEEAAERFINLLTSHSNFIVFSAATPGQGGQNHLNEQWPDYWQNIFLNNGFYPCESLRDHFWNNDEVEWWYRQNMIIYAPKDVLSNLNLSGAEKVRAVIHPGLLSEKLQLIDKLNGVIDREVWKPTFTSAFKRLIKSIIH